MGSDEPVAWLRRLREIGLELPPVSAPVAAYVPARLHGGLIWVSGQLPRAQGEIRYRGHLGGGVSLEDGQAAARLAALGALAAAAAVAPGGPAGLGAPLSVEGFVQCTPDFHEQPQVVNGASELFGAIFPGEGHRRSAIGCAALPLDAAVEIAVVFTVHPDGQPR